MRRPAAKVRAVPAFVFATCRPDATAWLRDEVARDTPSLRMSWSRPGVVTFRASDEAPPDPAAPLVAVFARSTGLTIGFAKTDDEVFGKLAEAPLEGPMRVHVYARDPKDEERRSLRVGDLIEKALSGAMHLPETVAAKSHRKARLKAFSLKATSLSDSTLSGTSTTASDTPATWFFRTRSPCTVRSSRTRL